MKSSMPTLPLKSQNKSFIKERILRNQKNFPTVNSEKSITTNESYTLLIDKNNKKQSSFNINSIISPRYVTIVNNINSGYFKKRTLDRSITKLPKIPKIKIISDADYLIKEYGFDKNRFIIVGNGSKKAKADGVTGANQNYRTTDFELINE